MKNKFSVGQIVGLLVFGLVAYAGVEYHEDLLLFLHKHFPREGRGGDAVKPAAPLAPLPAQIALCRKQGPGFQACMFQAGYAVNTAWSDAHKAASAGHIDPARAREVVHDPYRAEASPVYGVPYWAPRPPP